MLKSNTKIARQRIRKYITDGFTSLDDYEPTTEREVAQYILDEFCAEYINHNKNWQRQYGSYQNAFECWCAGLPTVLDTTFFYNVSAIDLVGDLLDETEEERNRFPETTAAVFMARLIWRELFAMGGVIK